MAQYDTSGTGYGRPPLHSRFKPGQSDNPHGRPKGARSFKSDLADELSETITVSEAGGELHISKQRAIVKALVDAAIGGDAKAATALINLCAKFYREEEVEPGAAEDEAFVDKLAVRERQIADEIGAVSSPSTKEGDDE